MSGDDDDKPTVILDLNAIKKQKLAQEEELANIVHELEFAVGTEDEVKDVKEATMTKSSPIATKANNVVEIEPKFEADNLDSETFAAQFLETRAKIPEPEVKQTRVILFDFNSDFFAKSKEQFPKGYDYHIATDLPQLNKHLTSKTLQIVVFNYDVNPKAVNQLTAQIKKKFPLTKTMIIAKSISPEKAKLHAATASGANGYYKLPLDASKVESELKKIQGLLKKAG